MKRALFIFFSLILVQLASGQVFNTGTTLKKGTFNVGVEPSLHIDGGANGLMLFGYAGYGIKSGMDMGLKIGIGEINYLGADLEFSLGKNISLSAGAHKFGDFGLDGTLLFDIPVRSDIRIYSGGDLDIMFPESQNGNGNIYTPLWVPIGLEILLSSRMFLVFETEIALIDAWHIIGGGLNFYF